MTSAIDTFTQAIEQATMADADVFCSDVVLDATVPNWRFVARGADPVRAELADWFADRGRFDELIRVPLPDGGELVEFTLVWEENGIPFACHQAHRIALREGRIATDTVFCGGRWPASLLAEMEAAQQATDRGQVHARG